MDNEIMADALRPFVSAPLVWQTPREIRTEELLLENEALRTRIAFLEAQWAAQWNENNK